MARSVLSLDEWTAMLEEIKSLDGTCNQYIESFREEDKRQFRAKELANAETLTKCQKQIYDILNNDQAVRREERQDDKEAEVLATLVSDYKTDKDSISQRISGTCEWFFDDSRFLKWRDDKDSSLLWVSAGPGCGKSVLARSLIDEMRVCTTAMTSKICYFFFKNGQEHRTRSVHALSAILHQLFGNTSLISYALPYYKRCGPKLSSMFSELWEMLLNCIKDPNAGEIICILDALDECGEDTRDQLISSLIEFFQKERNKISSFTLKFLVTSRPYDHIESQFERLTNASSYIHFDGDDQSEKIGQEINLVIDHKISSIARSFSPDDRNRIAGRLKGMENRTYLWLFLTFDIIEKSRSVYSKASKIETLLSNLPLKISDAYEKILAKSSDRNTAVIMLS